MDIQLGNKQLLLLAGLVLVLLVGAGLLGWFAGRVQSKPPSAAAAPSGDDFSVATAQNLQTPLKGVPALDLEPGANAEPPAGSKTGGGAEPEPESETVPESPAAPATDPGSGPDAATATALTAESQTAVDQQKLDLATQTEQQKATVTQKLSGLVAKLPGGDEKKTTGAGTTPETAGDAADGKAAAAGGGNGSATDPAKKEGAPSAAEKDPKAYSVQLGSFVAQSAALGLIARLEPLGFTGEILYARNHRNRLYFVVQLGDFDDYAAAAAAAEDFSAKAEMVAVVVPVPPYVLAQMKKPPEEDSSPDAGAAGSISTAATPEPDSGKKNVAKAPEKE